MVQLMLRCNALVWVKNFNWLELHLHGYWGELQTTRSDDQMMTLCRILTIIMIPCKWLVSLAVNFVNNINVYYNWVIFFSTMFYIWIANFAKTGFQCRRYKGMEVFVQHTRKREVFYLYNEYDRYLFWSNMFSRMQPHHCLARWAIFTAKWNN